MSKLPPALLLTLLAACATSIDDTEGASPVGDASAGATGGGGTAASGGTGRLCNPGSSSACACPGAPDGERVCSSDGQGFLGCDCSGSAQGGSGAGGSGQGGTAAGGAGQGGGTMVCGPGSQINCGCPGGEQGIQVCNDDGSGYEPCECVGAGGSGQGGTGAGGSGQGGTGAGGSGQGGSGQGGSGGGVLVVADSSAETCPGQVLDLSVLPVTVTGSTDGKTNDYSSVGCQYPTASTDLVFQFVAPTTTSLTLDVQPSGFDSVIYAWTSGTCDSGTPVCASGGVGAGDPDSLTLPVSAGQTYYFVVDGWTAGFAGPFLLEIR